jgi:glycosyltransferase involved in cell wall biosynthesis
VLSSFRRAKRLGASTIYELPIAHYRTVRNIMQREEAEFPGICRGQNLAHDFAPGHVAHKEAELEAADHVIVPSGFVEQSLIHAGFPADAITVLPSACEASWLADGGLNGKAAKDTNIVLHVGRLSLRKGTHRLLRAWKRLGAYRSHRLRLVGEMCLSASFLKDFQGCYEHLPHLPREKLREHYAAASLFVLPAAAEGFAAVILEALSYGVPVVASRNSGAEGFLEHRRHALLHEFGNEDELAAHLDWMLAHPKERAEMALQARDKARSWTWDDYRGRFLDLLRRLDGRP